MTAATVPSAANQGAKLLMNNHVSRSHNSVFPVYAALSGPRRDYWRGRRLEEMC